MGRTHIAFLRSINVGKRRVTNDELVAAFVAAGAVDAMAYQAAGNVLFSPVEQVGTDALSAALAAQLGFAVPVVVRSRTDLEALLAEEPFPKAALLRATGKAQVIFVKDDLSARSQAAIEAGCPPGDRLVATATHVHWLPADGVSNSSLRLTDIDRHGGVATVRTRSTVERIVGKLS